MFRLVQLEDGNYRLTVDYVSPGKTFAMHREYVFAPTKSDAKPCVKGERIELPFDTDADMK